MLVSTDAIAMGLNLPIKTVLFSTLEKWNGKEEVQLGPAEILQIAGRAGRFGRHEEGFGGALRGEDVRRIQNAASATRDDDAPRPDDVNRRARYTVNSRALQKWARERLRLETRADGSIEATFRYEGTTCSNLGVPLEFEYRVTLGPGEQDYRILEAEYAPAPGDAGHKAQCEYLNNADALLEAIAGEKPLLGRPLKEVLDWQRPSSPSGCYCAAESRMHKWGLVFEVIHFALASK